jgi:hypothetical protein
MSVMTVAFRLSAIWVSRREAARICRCTAGWSTLRMTKSQMMENGSTLARRC